MTKLTRCLRSLGDQAIRWLK